MSDRCIIIGHRSGFRQRCRAYTFKQCCKSHNLDADPDQDLACNFDADPDPACYFDADPDPAYYFDVDPDLSYLYFDAGLRILIRIQLG
jgi:hypothetical protein